MKYFIVSGEASGDLHASSLINQLKKVDKNSIFQGWGGERMKKEGATITKHYKELAFMGFTEVLMNIKTILKNVALCKAQIKLFSPDVVILVDYPGFNLKLAKWLKNNKIKTIYYISPQVWAWNASRVKKIKLYVDKMLCILPFEVDFYKKYNYDVEYVGHPLFEVIDKFTPLSENEFREKHNLPHKPLIALLPGSRKQEINRILSVMITICRDFSDYHFVIAGSKVQPLEIYKKNSDAKENVSLIFEDTYNLLSHSFAGIITSGTATLETALFGVPQVVVYKGATFSYLIARLLVKVNYISLVNIIANKLIVKELIQNQLTSLSLKKELVKLLIKEHQDKVKQEYLQLKRLLASGGGASKNAAKSIFDFLNE